MNYVGALWGGMTFNFPLTDAARADVPMANHSSFDDVFQKIEKLKARKAGHPNPFVLGWPVQERIFTAQEECALAARARARTASAK